MKKNVLLQLIVIYAGVSSMLAGLTYIVPVISAAAGHLFFERNTGYFEIIYLIAFILFIVCGFIIITKSGKISVYIAERAGLDDSLKLYTKPSQLLSIFIVILGLGHLLDYSPKLLHDLYLFFMGNHLGRAEAFGEGNGNYPQLFTNFLHVLLACLLIIFCRPLTLYFSKNILQGDEDMVAEHETINIETTE